MVKIEIKFKPLSLILAAKCTKHGLATPAKGRKDCRNDSLGGLVCTLTCNEGAYFYDSTPGEFNFTDTDTAKSIVYTCDAGGEWSPAVRVPDCIGLYNIEI